MAKKKKRKKGGKFKRFVLLTIFALLIALFAYGYACAKIVHVTYADVKIKGLDPFLEGTTILFASDFKMTDDSDAKHCAELINELCKSNPDIVLLGGDFTQKSFIDLFKSSTAQGEAEIEARLIAARRTFFNGIRGINPPGGIYVISGDSDAARSELGTDAFHANAAYLHNQQAKAPVKNRQITIVGVSDDKYAQGSSLFAGLTSDDCVIALTHDPDAYALLSTPRDPRNGNAYADIILAGHSLGGQIRAFGANLPSGWAGRFLSGLYNETGPNMLVSSGVGTEWFPIRLGSHAQVYILTLKKA